MADITMCADEECVRKDTCYRYTAHRNPYRRAYFMNSPKVKKMGGYDCDRFWDNGRKETSFDDKRRGTK